MKWLLVLFIAITVAAALVMNQSLMLEKKVQVVFCDVGQGDAVLVINGTTQLLFDVGANESILSCLSSHMPYFDRQIEYLFLTHSDLDHIGGLEDVISVYKINELILPMDTHFYDYFASYQELIQRYVSIKKYSYASMLTTMSVGNNLEVEIISPDRVFREIDAVQATKAKTSLSDTASSNSNVSLSKNNLSTIAFLHFYDFVFALMADAEEELELALGDRGLLTHVDMLKVAHHGSKTSTFDDFLNKTTPEHSVISVGKKNQYSHPSPQVIDRLLKYSSSLYRTDQVGDVVVTVYKDHYSITH